MPGKMIPPLPATFGESEHERFKRFAMAILAVPRSEIITPEQVMTPLEAEKRKIESKIAPVRREMAKRKAR